jgi:quercetin dioxygenase-like cupin family protein
MGVQITRRSGAVPARDIEADILAAFERRGLAPRRWSNAPGDVYAPHDHAYTKVLYCARGSITFRVGPSGDEVELFPGDRLVIEPHTVHGAVVGEEGVVCIEASRTD